MKKSFEELKKQIVHTTSLFATDDTFTDERFMRVRVAAMHTGINRNKSRFSKECVENAKDTFANIPILADVKVYKDKNGNSYLDYDTHNMHIEEDAFNEGEYRVIYDEQVVGIVPESNDFELVYDEESGEYYVYVTALLYRDYGNYVCDILENRNNQTDVSMEIGCNDISFSVEDGCLDVGEMVAHGITLLGADRRPGMANAHAEVFSIKEDTKQQQLIQIMQELKESLDNYTQAISQLNSEEGGNETVTKFEELLQRYNKTEADIEFEIENLSDEELEAKFAEVFESETTPASGEDDTSIVENLEGEGENPEGEGSENENFEGEPESTPETNTRTYSISRNHENNSVEIRHEISHDDIRWALYTLLEQYEELDDTYYYIRDVYDSYFIFESYYNREIYGCKYSTSDNNVALEGERYRLYEELLTESEKAELESMRANYAAIQEKLTDYENKELKEKKDSLFVSKDYSSISKDEEFIALKENNESLSFEELSAKLDGILLTYAKKGLTSANSEIETPEESNPVSKVDLPFNETSKKKSRYGSLFSKSN